MSNHRIFFPYLLFLIHRAGKFKKIHFNVKPIFLILLSGIVLRANSLGSEKIAEQSEQLHPSWCSTKFHRNSHPMSCTNTFEDWDKYNSLKFAAFPFSWNFITFPQIGLLPCVSNLFNLLLSACKNTTNDFSLFSYFLNFSFAKISFFSIYSSLYFSECFRKIKRELFLA